MQTSTSKTAQSRTPGTQSVGDDPTAWGTTSPDESVDELNALYTHNVQQALELAKQAKDKGDVPLARARIQHLLDFYPNDPQRADWQRMLQELNR